MISRPTEVRLIPGVLEFIQQLHQAKVDLAIATNKGHNSLIRALQATELDQLFKVTRSAGQVPAKPCPQMLEEIMEEFGRDPSSTLMIGDSTTDMEMAKRINVNAIGMDFYHQQEDALKAAGALAVFDDYKLLSAYLMLPEA
ncbi:phosphoglycolate phosphatase [Legionella pneumophila]|nr:phosphoglycolate phosphatase [Legionella pneumophila]CZJ24569.1 phosphoglycolate phosphatase [Legionella pneumophila]SFZ44879.1 phosphoglycolate phosphatase [Legionella pneumophila]